MIEAILLVAELCGMVLLLLSIRRATKKEGIKNLGLFAYKESAPTPPLPSQQKDNSRA